MPILRGVVQITPLHMLFRILNYLSLPLLVWERVYHIGRGKFFLTSIAGITGKLPNVVHVGNSEGLLVVLVGCMKSVTGDGGRVIHH